MMPTLWVSCTALVLVAVFVRLLAVAVALPFVDDVRLWVDWYPPLLRAVPYCLVGSYVSLFTHFTLCAILCRLTRRPVSTHAMSTCLSTCALYCRLRLFDSCTLLGRLLHSGVSSCTL